MHMQRTLGKRSRRRLSSNVLNVSDFVLRMSIFEMLPCACFSHLFCLRLLLKILSYASVFTATAFFLSCVADCCFVFEIGFFMSASMCF